MSRVGWSAQEAVTNTAGAWTTGVTTHTLEPGTPDLGAQGRLLLRPVSIGSVSQRTPLCLSLSSPPLTV